jgi:hypothetical protein
MYEIAIIVVIVKTMFRFWPQSPSSLNQPPAIKALVHNLSAFTTLFAAGKSWDNLRTTAAPFTESRLAHLVRNKCVAFLVVEHNLSYKLLSILNQPCKNRKETCWGRAAWEKGTEQEGCYYQLQHFFFLDTVFRYLEFSVGARNLVGIGLSYRPNRAQESISRNRFRQPMQPGRPVRQIGLSYRPARLGMDSWAP